MTTEPQIKSGKISVYCGVQGQTTKEKEIQYRKVFIASYIPSCDHVTVELEGISLTLTVDGRELIQAIRNAMNSDGNW